MLMEYLRYELCFQKIRIQALHSRILEQSVSQASDFPALRDTDVNIFELLFLSFGV